MEVYPRVVDARVRFASVSFAAHGASTSSMMGSKSR